MLHDERLVRGGVKWPAKDEPSLNLGWQHVPDVTIRQYRPADLDACRALWAELTERHRQLYADPSIGGEAPGLYFDRHLETAGPERLWVAESRLEVVGLTGLLSAGPDGEVEPVIVSEGWRGHGIGQALVARVIEEARRLGLRYLSVRPVARNAEAVTFFHRAGFRALGQIDLTMAVAPNSPVTWQPGAVLHGLQFNW